MEDPTTLYRKALKNIREAGEDPDMSYIEAAHTGISEIMYVGGLRRGGSLFLTALHTALYHLDPPLDPDKLREMADIMEKAQPITDIDHERGLELGDELEDAGFQTYPQ